MSNFLKKFAVEQDHCYENLADGVLLGMRPSNKPVQQFGYWYRNWDDSALMLTRLHASRIDCLEIDEAYEQAVENFENTPWSDVYFVFMLA
jgi:tRNA1Val (adenine37-N6)-methyltransferase